MGSWVRVRSDGNGRSLLLFLLLLSMPAFLAYCTKPLTHRQEMVANRPQKKVFKFKPDVVKEAVERVLEKKKFYLDTRQTNELHIQTEWLEDGGYRSMVVADIKQLARSKTELKLQMFLEQKLVFRDKWKPMDEIGEDTYKIMLSDIEMECFRVLYDRS
ncbi:MAG: hypothetical protein V3U56_11695 [Syntrophobacteria bacterium]